MVLCIIKIFVGKRSQQFIPRFLEFKTQNIQSPLVDLPNWGKETVSNYSPLEIYMSPSFKCDYGSSFTVSSVVAIFWLEELGSKFRSFCRKTKNLVIFRFQVYHIYITFFMSFNEFKNKAMHTDMIRCSKTRYFLILDPIHVVFFKAENVFQFIWGLQFFAKKKKNSVAQRKTKLWHIAMSMKHCLITIECIRWKNLWWT